MGCCGLCRSKSVTVKPKTKHLATEKLNKIDLWIENIEGPYDFIDLPVNPAEEPKLLSNKEEQVIKQRNQNIVKHDAFVN